MMTFHIREEHDDMLDRRIAMIRAIGARLCPVTKAAIVEEVETIAALSAWKPDDWTLSHLDGVIRTVQMIEEAGL